MGPTNVVLGIYTDRSFFNTAGKDATSVFEVIDAYCQLASNALFGPVNGGRLVLLAKLLTQNNG
jgi:hypothetical protein